MAKKFILAPSNRGGVTSVPISSIYDDSEKRTKSARNLAKFSKLDIDWDVNAIKNSLTSSLTDDSNNLYYANSIPDEYSQYSNFTGNNEYVAFFDKSYEQRRAFLKMFAADALIEQCVETIADESIVYDSRGYFAQLDTKNLQAKLKDTDESKAIIKGLTDSFNHVYYKFGFVNSISAWEYMIKLLVEGLLSFEIIFEYDDQNRATTISSFKEIDPISLKPGMRETSEGLIKYWTQSRGIDAGIDLYSDAFDEGPQIPDGHIIYISWASRTNQSKVSYVERLVRSFNLLRQLENSRIIWNIQNAQQKVKITVPVGEQNEERIKTRLGRFRAMYKEDVTINSQSGEVIYNGTTNFPFAKNIIIPTNSQGSIDIAEIQKGGYDLNSTEQLKYFWDRFIAETKIPRNRFSNTISLDKSPTSIVPDSSTANHEEYAFSRFLKRVRSIFKEILLKPTWIEFGLRYPQYANMPIIKNYLGLAYNDENIFTLFKERQILSEGASAIGSLSGLQDYDQTPFFSNRFLIGKFLGLSESDTALNAKLKKLEKEALAKKNEQDNADNAGDSGFGGDFGGGSDFGGGGDTFGGADFGGDTGGFDIGGGESEGGFGPDEGGADLGGGDTGATEETFGAE